MKTNKQNADFLHIGKTLLKWYEKNGRQLPWRENKQPYTIWISEIVLQQTQVKQGLNHYLRFIERFPTVKDLQVASEDDVLLHWKGLGYYSRAINLHKAAHQIMTDYKGIFPNNYNDIINLKGVGKYTASAISSICFGEKRPAVDGNFYRVLSRIFADDFDISDSKAFDYFSELALLIMPDKNVGDLNQAIMDLGSEICKPKNPICGDCPINAYCLAYGTKKSKIFPVKSKKTKVSDLNLTYFFVKFENQFLIQQRGDDFIWKKLYEFPTIIPSQWSRFVINSKTVLHKLSHKNLSIDISTVELPSKKDFEKMAKGNQFLIVNKKQAHKKSFPKPLQTFYESLENLMD